MTRVISLFLPNWSTDRHRRKLGDAAPPADAALVMVGREGRRQVVLAVNAAAYTAGLRVGMPATKAQVLVPGLLVENHDAAADAEALERIALWLLQRYAPIVAVDPPDGIVIDATGTDHLHGGEEGMLSDIVSRLTTSGIEARAAIAGSWGAAYALARYVARPIAVSQPHMDKIAIEPLPIAALRVSQDLVESLKLLGFTRVGDLLATPRAPLTLRFGPLIGRRIDQALGFASEPIDPIRPDDLIEVRQAFAEPIGAAETIARYLGKLVVLLCEGLGEKGLGARRLDLLCHRVDGQRQAIRVGTATPVRDVKRLTRLLTDKIETIEPGFGIELMTLTATIAEPLAQKQTITSLVDDPIPDVSDLVDVLTNRVGDKRLYRVTALPSDVPERSVQRIAPMAAETGAIWPGHWPRPSRLLPRPEAIEVVALLPDHPPASFTWRGVRRRVRRADGPERVFGEWWLRDPELAAVRDYFRVEDEAGERFWLYRAGDGEDAATGSQGWFIHGVFG